jgi:5-methylcytosine-specific restriction endonuclease McrA
MRKRPFEICERKHLPQRLKAEIMLRQQGCCADCGTRLILGFFVFDHRPPLGLRDKDEDANDPERLAAICWSCDELKTPQDLKEIAKAKRLAERHQEHQERQRFKVPGRRLPSRKQWRQMQGALQGSSSRQIRSAGTPSFLRLPGSKKQER